ncbi:ABC transporter substrate-binding protein [Caenispirillum bisanense]|uniref:ABC transporter substrate-binding protein n=1 Tax=Caenispirillum bisanense TaxID=414052 RepID=UPI0031D81F4C
MPKPAPSRARRVIVATLCMLPLVLLAALTAAPASAADKVVLQLRWSPSFQFAGYYAALWQGYYAEAGLDVELRSGLDAEGRPLAVPEEVQSGRAHFGVSGADILVADDRGEDLVVIGSFFQHSGVALFMRDSEDLRTLGDALKKDILRRPGDLTDVSLMAMAVAAGFEPPEVHLTGSSRDFFAGRGDGYVGYVISTPYHFAEQGVKARMFRPLDYGVDFYGDSLFATRDLVRSSPEMAEAMLRATRRGWEYALRNPDEIVARLSEMDQGITFLKDNWGLNRFMVEPVRKLTAWPMVELGHVNPDRWERMHATLARFGMVSGTFNPDTFLFNSVRMEAEEARRTYRLLGLVAAVLAAGLAVAGFGVWALRRMVIIRTQALLESEQSLRRFISAVKDYAIVLLDQDGRVVSWNDGATRLFGWRQTEIIGQSFAVFHTTTARANGEPEAEMIQASHDGTTPLDRWQLRKDGSQFQGEGVLAALTAADGRLRGFLMVVRDVTRRRQAEDRIRFQAHLLNEVRTAIVATDTGGAITYINRRAEETFGLSAREAIGLPLAALDLFPPDVLGADPDRTGDLDVTLKRRDGSPLPALVTVSRLPRGSGERPPGLIYSAFDQTERRRMEGMLRQAGKMAVLGEMSASLIHEISQPMNIIRLIAESAVMALDRAPADADPQDLRRLLGGKFSDIVQQAERLVDTFDYIQAFSRRDSGPKEPFRVQTAIAQVAALFEQQAAKDGLTLELDLAPDAEQAIVIGHRNQLDQVLLNLLRNAMQALLTNPQRPRRPPFGTIRLCTAIANRGTHRELRLVVEDSGPGIAADAIDRIFEPFFTTKPAGEGTGLGLSICLDIVHDMGGDMGAGNRPEGGARFTIFLPLADPATLRGAPPPAAAPAPALPAGDGARLLVVDDEVLAAEVIADSLREEGYAVTVAHDLKTALSLLDEVQPDAVITDLHLPDGRGEELITRLGEDWPQVFTIVMTGQPLSERLHVEHQLSGVDALLRKPVSMREVKTRLAHLLHSDELAEEGTGED